MMRLIFLIILFSNSLLGYSQETDSIRRIRKWIPPNPDEINILLSIPEFNHFFINKGNKYGSESGFLGFSFGIQYWISSNRSILTQWGFAQNFPVMIPAYIEFDPTEGVHSQVASSFISIQMTEEFGVFDVAAGLQFTYSDYSKSGPLYVGGDTTTFSITRVQNQIGLAFSGNLRVAPHLKIGVNYYPSVFGWSNKGTAFRYTHLAFLNFIVVLHSRE